MSAGRACIYLSVRVGQGRLFFEGDRFALLCFISLKQESCLRIGMDNAYRCAGSRGEGGGGSHVMHGRSRMAIDPRIPAMPGWSMSGFH